MASSFAFSIFAAMESERLIEEVRSIAVEAGIEIMRIYGEGAFDVEMKADNSPLTRADKAANQVICQRLESLSVQYPVVSEENREIPFSLRKTFHRCWVVDPLDGTKEFISRNGEFTVNIALIENGQPILGVVSVPFSGEVFYAVKGGGAFLERNNAVTRMQVSRFSLHDRGLKVVCSRSHLNPETKTFIEQLNDPQAVSRGSALKFMMIASGEADLYPRLAPTMEWDVAAAQCIVEEAGGFIIDYQLRSPLVYNKENLLNPFFLAGGNTEL